MKLLIADDEENIRMGLKEVINWKSLGLEEIFAAADGIEALEVFKEHLPEIVITDVRMPGMDGLELSEKIKEISPSVHIIILSGYSEFEYAKKAMKLGVADYELKPVNIKELTGLVAAARDEIIEAARREEEEKEHRVLFKSRFVEGLLSGSMEDRQQIKEFLAKNFRFDVRGAISCFTLEVDNYCRISSVMDADALKPVMDLVKNSVNHILRDREFIVHQKYESSLVVLFKTPFPVHSFRQRLKELHRDAGCSLKEYNITISLGVSDAGTIEEAPDLYSQSLQALKHKLYKGADSVIFYSDICTVLENSILNPVDEKNLREYIRGFDYDSTSAAIYKEFDILKKSKCIDNDFVKNVCIDLKNILIRAVKDAGIDFSALTHVKVVASGSNIKVYVNNETTPRIDVNDSTYTSGYVSLATCGTHSHFDNAVIKAN